LPEELQVGKGSTTSKQYKRNRNNDIFHMKSLNQFDEQNVNVNYRQQMARTMRTISRPVFYNASNQEQAAACQQRWGARLLAIGLALHEKAHGCAVLWRRVQIEYHRSEMQNIKVRGDSRGDS
jgi:hypothetical protein